MLEILALIVLVSGLWLWVDTLRAREAALAAGREACERYGVLLLDETVACIRTRPGRNDEGRLALARSYRFEFSDTGNNRREGQVDMLGNTPMDVRMEPWPVQLRVVGS